MAVALKYQRFRKVCAFERCSKPFACWRKTQRFCSQKCHARSRPEHQRAAGRLGARASSDLRLKAIVAEIRASMPGLSDEALRMLLKLRRTWWNQGYQTGFKAGRRRGWAQALGEREDAA